MHYKSAQPKSSFRFRRWSRAGYAVFCSLSCCVSIGALAVSVSDKTLRKSEGDALSFVQSYNENKETKENDPDEIQALLQQVSDISLSELKSDSAACALFEQNIINRNG